MHLAGRQEVLSRYGRYVSISYCQGHRGEARKHTGPKRGLERFQNVYKLGVSSCQTSFSSMQKPAVTYRTSWKSRDPKKCIL